MNLTSEILGLKLILGPFDEELAQHFFSTPLERVPFRKEILFGQQLLATSVAEFRIQQGTALNPILGGTNWLNQWNYIPRLEEIIRDSEIPESVKELLLSHAIYIIRVQ